MRSASINAPIIQAAGEKAMVWFGGDTALVAGQAVCYNFDYGTATAVDGSRLNRVEVPTILNAPYFAGVTVCSYGANTGGRMIEIWLPGSLCEVHSLANSTIGVGRLTFEAGGSNAGYFRYEGFQGQGSCIPLQTVDRSSTAGLLQVALETGPQSGGTEVVTVAAAGGAETFMVGGVSYLPAVTLAADATAILADGTLNSQRKGFYLVGALTDNNLVVTITSGMQADGSTALTKWTADAATDEITLEWSGVGALGVWREVAEIGGVKAST